GDTPALYYAQAAWAFKNGNPDQGNDWIVSAKKIYSPTLNIVFADSFYDVGWLTHPTEAAPPTAALAQANASPPAATPAMRMGQAEAIPAPVIAEGPAAGAAVAKAAVAATTATPLETKPTPTSAPSAVAASSPVSAPSVAAKQP